MKILELFCGTKSFSNVAEEQGHQVYTVDFDKQFNPNLVIDVLKLTPELIIELFGKPDMIWASPPCTEYSHAKRRGIRDLAYADKVVKKTIELIRELSPKFWIIENPQTGLLKDRVFMKNIPFTDVSYCKYGKPYRKQTRFWNNFSLILEVCNKDCDYMDGKKHIMSVGNGRKRYTKDIKFSSDKRLKYQVPRELCASILTQLTKTENAIPPKPKVLGILANFI